EIKNWYIKEQLDYYAENKSKTEKGRKHYISHDPDIVWIIAENEYHGGYGVKALRLAAKVSPQELADFLGISSPHLANLEGGNRPFTDENMEKVSLFFRLNATEAESLDQSLGKIKEWNATLRATPGKASPRLQEKHHASHD